jgi:hypothetical protein
LKKPVGSVRFRFYKQKTEPKLKKTGKKPSQTRKTEPNRKNQAKTGKPSQNRAKTEKTEPKPEKPSQTGLNQFLP